MNVETLVPDDLWALVAPLLPPHPPHRKGGRPWLSDRCALCGIMFVLKTGCGWNALPGVLGCGSGSTCWRRLRDWQGAGVWQALHRAILDRLGALGALDWSRVSVDSASLRAKKGAMRWGRTRPIGASRAPSVIWRLIARGCRWPLALTGAERPDATVFAAVIASIPPVRGSRGRPRQRPEKVHADKGYDARHCRRYLHRRGIKVRIARKGVEDKSRLGRWRWVVERTFAWLNHYRRLAIRYERREALHQAFLDLACALICLKALRRHAKGLCNE